MNPRQFLKSLFDAAVAAADPRRAVAEHLPPPPKGRTVVIGAGKASAAMAQALELAWAGPISGLVVTRYGYAATTSRIRVIEAAHPVPDESGMVAAQTLLGVVRSLSPDDLVIALISGGGSALLPAPPDGLTLEDEVALNRVLLASGAPISAMNTVRKHLSTVKGGRLAAATRARVHTLVVSDIPGDVAAQVASGPTIPDASTRAEALEAISRYRMELPERVMAHLRSPAADAPRPVDPIFARHTHTVIASAGLSLKAAVIAAQSQGVEAAILSDALEGEAREAGKFHAAIARQVHRENEPFRRPVVLLSGGETTVTINGEGGRGGRNGEFLLSFAVAAEGISAMSALAADTDGIDGTEQNAGAYADGLSVMRMREKGLDPRKLLDANDSYTAFEAVNDLFVTGPTGTNVNDFRAVYLW